MKRTGLCAVFSFLLLMAVIVGGVWYFQFYNKDDEGSKDEEAVVFEPQSLLPPLSTEVPVFPNTS